MRRLWVVVIAVVLAGAGTAAFAVLRDAPPGGPLQEAFDQGKTALGACEREPGTRFSYGNVIENHTSIPMEITKVSFPSVEGVEIIDVVQVPPRLAVLALDGYPPGDVPWNQNRIKPLVGTTVEGDTVIDYVIGLHLLDDRGRVTDVTIHYTMNGKSYKAVDNTVYEFVPSCSSEEWRQGGDR